MSSVTFHALNPAPRACPLCPWRSCPWRVCLWRHPAHGKHAHRETAHSWATPTRLLGEGGTSSFEGNYISPRIRFERKTELKQRLYMDWLQVETKGSWEMDRDSQGGGQAHPGSGHYCTSLLTCAGSSQGRQMTAVSFWSTLTCQLWGKASEKKQKPVSHDLSGTSPAQTSVTSTHHGPKDSKCFLVIACNVPGVGLWAFWLVYI